MVKAEFTLGRHLGTPAVHHWRKLYPQFSASWSHFSRSLYYKKLKTLQYSSVLLVILLMTECELLWVSLMGCALSVWKMAPGWTGRLGGGSASDALPVLARLLRDKIVPDLLTLDTFYIEGGCLNMTHFTWNTLDQVDILALFCHEDFMIKCVICVRLLHTFWSCKGFLQIYFLAHSYIKFDWFYWALFSLVSVFVLVVQF